MGDADGDGSTKSSHILPNSAAQLGSVGKPPDEDVTFCRIRDKSNGGGQWSSDELKSRLPVLTFALRDVNGATNPNLIQLPLARLVLRSGDDTWLAVAEMQDSVWRDTAD